MKHITGSISGIRRLGAVLLALLIFSAAPSALLSRSGSSAYAASTDISAKVSASAGAILRKAPSTSSDRTAVLKDGTAVTIVSEVFTNADKTDADTRWYLVNAGSRKGYLRSDLVKDRIYPSIEGYTTDALNYRAGAGTEQKKLGTLPKGTKVTVCGLASAKGSGDKWYALLIGSTRCYAFAEYITLGPVKKPAAVSNDAIRISGGSSPVCLYKGQAFTIRGRLTSSRKFDRVRVGVTDQKGKWVRGRSATVKAASFDLHTLDSSIKFGTLAPGSYYYTVKATRGSRTYTVHNCSFEVIRSEVAARLRANPTYGGACRQVYEFSSSNCRKLFPVTGYGSAHVPQGFAYTGSRYHIVFGMSDAQSIVTYSSSGKRLSAVRFPYNMGHPNSMTWDPQTGLCYIFKGNQKKIYTWNPETGKFGTSSTPYSSSGIAYDSSDGLLYASSLAGIRAYSSDGKFSHLKYFSRCSHSGKTYVQDCGAGGGFVFHGVSGADKASTNFLDVYRTADGAYMGSVRVRLGEIESATVDKDGYVVLLINTMKDRTDYIWKTNLNVKDLA